MPKPLLKKSLPKSLIIKCEKETLTQALERDCNTDVKFCEKFLRTPFIIFSFLTHIRDKLSS